MKKENEEVCGCCGKGMHIIAALVAIAIIAVAFTAGSAMTPSKVIISPEGQNLNMKTLNASGSVTKIVAPDKAEIVLSVETLDESAQKSQADNAALADKVSTAIQSLSSVQSEIKTLSYSENEEFEWNDITKKSESKGYRTTNQIQVTLKGDYVSRAGTIIDVAVQAGANRVSSISFGLSKEKELEIRKQALGEAASTAKAKADSMASGLGVQILGVHSISESSFYYAPNYANYDLAKAPAEAISAATPIAAGEVEVNASVSVEFELK